ncbi:hypothetical protein MMC06_004823 [Schaereria dolodes]|nr:hypothetical protein [Schaereria dolodes]
MAMAVIGLLMGIASIPMMESYYADKITEGEVYTNVKIGAGSTLANESSYSTGGHNPNVALWGSDGHRIGRYYPGSGDKIPDGTQTTIKVQHGDTEPSNAAKQPEYIFIMMNDDDALCINYVAVTGPDNNQMAWYGDVGYSCGGDWYHSQYKIGQNDYMPKCVWLSIRPTTANKLRHQGMGIHITDFNSDSDKLAKQYQKYPDSMCKTAPRFKLYERSHPDDVLPIYFPPLDLVPTDNTDVDPVATSKNQGIKGGDPAMKVPKRDLTSNPPASNTTHTRYTNEPGCRFDGHLIVSHHDTHSAVELCEHDFSVGPDFVSITEETFCDMYTKLTWPLCTDALFQYNNDPENNGALKRDQVIRGENKVMAANATMTHHDLNKQVTVGCFDIVTKSMRSAGPHRRSTPEGKEPPVKSYQHSAQWK